MAGSSKGRYFCWAQLTEQRCPNKDCATFCHMVDNPAACPKCGAPLDFRCRRKLKPDQKCEQHRRFASGPSCWQQVLPPPATAAQKLARHMSPHARPFFAEFLHMQPADILRHMAARTASQLEVRGAAGTLVEGQEVQMLKAIADLLDREGKLRLIAKELDPPKLKEPDAYDFTKLDSVQLRALDELLALCSVQPGTHDVPALTAARVRKQRDLGTADDAWFGNAERKSK